MRGQQASREEIAVEAATIAELLLGVGAVELRAREPFFTFASGLRSPIYTDNRLLISDPPARRTICQAFAERMQQQKLQPEVIAGTATAGIPHAALLAEHLGLPMVYVRGGSKGHGKGKRVEGRLAAGAKVLLIEDLITTGGSSVSAAEGLIEAGAEVMGVLAIFSYGFETARERFEQAGVPFTSLVTFDDVLDLAQQRGELDLQQLALLRCWKAAPEQWPEPTATEQQTPTESLIVAADLPSTQQVERLAQQMAGVVGYLKLNSAFIRGGAALVERIRKLGLSVFLDLKFHDIPNTAANYVRQAAAMGVGLLTIHAGGGPQMIRACVEAAQANGEQRPRVLAVTALTSMSDDDLQHVGVQGGRQSQVVRLAKLAQQCGADGVVCSVAEADLVRQACGPALLIVTPGVRPAGSTGDDHARTATPEGALRAGADYVVVGRPIYQAADPVQVARQVAAELR